MPLADAPTKILASAFDASEGKDRFSGRPNASNWGSYEYLLSADVEEHPISFFYETSGEEIIGINDGWFETFFPIGTDYTTVSDYITTEFGTGPVTWMDYKLGNYVEETSGEISPAAAFRLFETSIIINGSAAVMKQALRKSFASHGRLSFLNQPPIGNQTPIPELSDRNRAHGNLRPSAAACPNEPNQRHC